MLATMPKAMPHGMQSVEEGPSRHGAPTGGLFAGGTPVLGLTAAELQASLVEAARDAEIVGQGEPAGRCYLVLSGCLRTVRLLEDGRRQIGEFLLAGALFGWEALGEHSFGAEAVTPVTLLCYSRQRLEALAERDPRLAGRLRQVIAGQLRASRERMVVLGRKVAVERVASFLLEMAARLGTESGRAIELPMSRTDIADYLGLTIETVCRGITHFRREGWIGAEQNRIAIRDRVALERAGCERLH